MIVGVRNGETEVEAGDGVFVRACLPGRTSLFNESEHNVEVSLDVPIQSLVGALIWDFRGDPFCIVEAMRRSGLQARVRVRPLTRPEELDLYEREAAEIDAFENPKKLPPPWWERL